MAQIKPARNSLHRGGLISSRMISKGLGRRQILRLPWGLAGGRLAGRRVACGGALFWTELVQPGGLPALAQVRVSTTPPLVMIDPGHGGHDPGATGVTGTLEKHITLAAGRMIKEALERDGRYRVELTRTEDLYVPREERVTIARALGADLFLSMHADVLSDASVRGASVYTLARAASDAETAALADRENGVVPAERQAVTIRASLFRPKFRAFWPAWRRGKRGPLPTAWRMSWCAIWVAACRCCPAPSGTRISRSCMPPASPAC